MATRALIGYLNPDNTITTTYNHYDGYPENLGKALDRHYSTDEKAKEIANMGYVSFVEPVNGDIEANNQEAPVTVGDDDLVSSLQYFKKQADGTDYAYLWAPQTGDWMHARTSIKMEDFVDNFTLGIDFQDEDDMADYDTINNMEEGYQAKWKKFLGENVVDETEFNFLNYILGDKYSDDEIEMYLKSDSFIEASRDDDMEMVADNASNWENEFFEFFDNTDNV
tara:strand:- start:150 stop:821 length:672 start_codon:yes stop_codon:yes gene_type:complete